MENLGETFVYLLTEKFKNYGKNICIHEQSRQH